MLKKHFKNTHCEFYEQFSCWKRMFPVQSLAVECEVRLSHAGGSKVTKPIFSNSRKRYYCAHSLPPRLLQSIFPPGQSRVGSLVIFTWPGSWAFANPGANPQLLIRMWIPLQI